MLFLTVKPMDIEELQSLADASAKLPDNAFFAYRNLEIIEFIILPPCGIALINDTFVSAECIVQEALSLQFD
ncbi:hypothetical protein KUL17_25530 [Alteromonas sp. KUL17]|nr:hypothetical protein KUL17_25530 [Alteromonas sp. KUL17]